MKTELIVGESAFLELAGEWDRLASRGMTDTPFQTLDYQKAWWTHLHPQNSTLLTVASRDENGQLVGIGCFYNFDGGLYFNGCVEETDYLDLMVAADLAEAVWESTLACLQDIELPSWSSLDLCNIPETSPTRTILPLLARRHALSYEEKMSEVCPVITLPDSFEAYLEMLESKQRRELSRKLRRAEAADVSTTIISSADNLEAEVDEFLDLLQKSTFEKRDWLNDGRRAVFQDVARAAQSTGILQLMFTSIEGRRAAALFNFDYKDRIWVYNSGLDPSAFSALSPGVVLTATAIEQAIKLDRKEFDFLRGNEEYKYRFGATDTRIFHQRLERAA